MTIVEGQIETLKSLKESLSQNGITRFNSVGEIRRFISDYDFEKHHIPNKIALEFDKEIERDRETLSKETAAYADDRRRIRDEIEEQISALRTSLKQATDRSDKWLFFKVLYVFRIPSITRKISRLEKNPDAMVDKRTRLAKKSITMLETSIEESLENRDIIVSRRCTLSLDELNRTKQVIDGLYPLVAGAIGETAVVNALQKLPDDYYLVNDFSLELDPPIYNRRENDRIYSIQIDHLLICRAGVFLLETKNWSKSSVESLDLRSPVDQIKRASFALFVLLNSDSRHKRLALPRHHWGDRKVPIKNVVVMINHKPRAEFKHVKVLLLDQLIGYVQYFDQVFSQQEVESIFKSLTRKLYLMR